MRTIDGSRGEGGGQILRTTLALASLTGEPVTITNIRRGRSKPGLMRQHLAAVRASAEIASATVEGDALGSTELVFRPGAVRGGAYRFPTGGAGSTSLVFQTVLYPLLFATEPSTVVFEGGTHNPMAPPTDFLARAFLPQLAKLGGHVTLRFVRHGFYPAGGGAWNADITPVKALGALDLATRGELTRCSARALVAKIPGAVARREVDALSRALGWDRAACTPEVIADAPGPGNALVAEVASTHVTEVFTGFGERGVSAEAVAEGVAREVRRYLATDVPVFEHLADQLLLPMALGGGGVFRTVALSEHARTQIALLGEFLGTRVEVTEEGPDVVRVSVSARARSASSASPP